MYRSHDHLCPVEAPREHHHVGGLQRVRSLIATARSFSRICEICEMSDTFQPERDFYSYRMK